MRMLEQRSTFAPISGTSMGYGVSSRGGEDEPRFKITTRPRKSRKFSTLDHVWHSFITTELLIVGKTPRIEDTFIEVPDLSPLEMTIETLRSEGKVSEEFVVDLFSQQAIYDAQQDRLQREFAGREIVISGGEVFDAETFSEALGKARAKFPDRPYYSVSLRDNPATF